MIFLECTYLIIGAFFYSHVANVVSEAFKTSFITMAKVSM